MKNVFGHMNMDKKMKIFIFFAIGITALSILFTSTISYMSLLRKTSQSLVANQVHAMSTSLQNAFYSYRNISTAFMLDRSVQKYLHKNMGSVEVYENQIQVKEKLFNAINIQSSIQFFAIVRGDVKNDCIYTGATAFTSSQFYDRYEKDMKGARQSGIGALRINFQSSYYNNDPYMISVYHPLYSTTQIGRELGMLCFSVKEPALRQILDIQNRFVEMHYYLVDDRGITVSCTQKENIGEPASFFSRLTDQSGTIEEKGRVLIYEKLDEWNYYIVGDIPESALYRDGIQMVLWLVFAIILMVTGSLLLGTRIVKKSYKAIDDVVMSLESVSAGKMSVRMDEDMHGEDFAKIARGFNLMMKELNHLMEQVKKEQHQIEQAKLNALQSQIKPHFLYNTLECIHWQAEMDKNKEISRMVKALASYYRICLSGGKDVIDLFEELNHIENYIMIQNVRYGDIVKCHVQVEPEYHDVQIPKMTLQPLVENSIYHGIKIKEGNSGNIWIQAKRDKMNIILSVEDDGSKLDDTRIEEMNAFIRLHDEDFGYGIRNVHKRIQLSFGKEYGLYYRAGTKNGLKVEIRLPGKKVKPDEDDNNECIKH